MVGSLRQAKYVDVLAAYENVRLIEGCAAFVSSDTIQVDGRNLRASRIIVTTGSRPWIPPIPGLREAEPLFSKNSKCRSGCPGDATRLLNKATRKTENGRIRRGHFR